MTPNPRKPKRIVSHDGPVIATISKPGGESFDRRGTFEKVETIAEWILAVDHKLNKDETLSGAEILERARGEYPDLPISDATFIQYLNNI